MSGLVGNSRRHVLSCHGSNVKVVNYKERYLWTRMVANAITHNSIPKHLSRIALFSVGLQNCLALQSCPLDFPHMSCLMTKTQISLGIRPV